MTNTVEVKGIKELNTILKNLPEKVRSRLVYNAIRKAAEPMKQEAKQLAPVNKGTIKKAITIVRDSRSKEPVAILSVTKGRRVAHNAWYAHFQERGTSGFGRRTRIETYDKGAARTAILSGLSVSQRKLGRRVGSYLITTKYKRKGIGLPAVRFMSTAFGDKADIVLSNIKNELSNIVVKYLRKNAPEYYAD